MSKIEVELQEFMGSDVAIANAAWTSTYNKAKRESDYEDKDKVARLIARMAREGHSTPFESVVFRFWIRMPIHTDRQHMTHRIASHNGLSGRYRTLPIDYYEIPDDVFEILNRATMNFGDGLRAKFNEMMEEQVEFYRDILDVLKGSEAAELISNTEYKRVREIIRGVIGTASMVERTTIFNLRSFANYQRLRNSHHAQAEIKQVAQMMLEQVNATGVCPLAITALENNGWRI